MGLRSGKFMIKRQAHGIGSTTGVGVNPWQEAVVSCGLDGSVKAWRVEGGTLQLAGSPKRLNPDTPFEVPTVIKESAAAQAPCMGLTKSGGGSPPKLHTQVLLHRWTVTKFGNVYHIPCSGTN